MCRLSRYTMNSFALQDRHRVCLRILVCLVIYDSGYMSFEHLLLLRHPSQNPSSQPTLSLSQAVLQGPHLPLNLPADIQLVQSLDSEVSRFTVNSVASQ